MPLYFFHLRDGEDVLIDAEGMDLGGASEAKAAALRQARDIISHDALRGHINLAQRIDVLDQAGAIVCTLNFSDAVEIRR